MAVLNFAGVDIPSYVRVNSIKYSILPTLDHKSQKVFGRAGVYDFGVELGARQIDCEIQIIGVDQADVMKKAREFTKWLFHKDLQRLIVGDEPDKFYMARVIDQTEVAELYTVGRSSIRFVCPSAYAESLTEKQINAISSTTSAIAVDNTGTVETYPVFDITVKEDTPLVIVASDDKFVQIGRDNVEQVKVAVINQSLHDDFSTYTGYTTAVSVDGGDIVGTFVSDGAKLSVSDYGTGTKWHGPSGIKSLTTALQDFELVTNIDFKASNINQIGRVEVYLLDANNVHIGKLAFVDGNAGASHPRVEARAGSLTGGKYFMTGTGTNPSVWSDFTDGVLKIGRKGNKWFAYVGKRSYLMGKWPYYHSRMYKEFIDIGNQFNQPLAKIQIHIASYSTYGPVNSMAIKDLVIYDRSVNAKDGETPIIFKANDIITVDNHKAIVYRNGEPIFTELNAGSDFFPLDIGSNGISVHPANSDVSIRYRERYL